MSASSPFQLIADGGGGVVLALLYVRAWDLPSNMLGHLLGDPVRFLTRKKKRFPTRELANNSICLRTWSTCQAAASTGGLPVRSCLMHSSRYHCVHACATASTTPGVSLSPEWHRLVCLPVSARRLYSGFGVTREDFPRQRLGPVASACASNPMPRTEGRQARRSVRKR